MRVKKILLGVSLLLAHVLAHAQTLTIEFPKFAGKTYDFLIFQGDNAIKIHEGDTIPPSGIVTIEIPKPYSPYTGMSRWLLTNAAEGGGLDMAIPGHGFKVSCLSDKPDESNIVWEGYDAINELNRLYRMQQEIIDRFDAISKVMNLYEYSHPLYHACQKEKEVQQQAYVLFHKELRENTNYNARFLPIVNLVSGIPTQLTNDWNQRARLVNEYIVFELNYDHLYTSGHWSGIIQSWVQMHTQQFENETDFAEAFNTIGQRISEPVRYTDFVGRVTNYLLQYAKDDFIEAIAPSVVGSGKITSWLDKTMQVYVTALVGATAPDLVITEHIGPIEAHHHEITTIKSSELASGKYEQTLLVFYQSGCGPCEELMQKLPGRYEDLQRRNIRLITISADESEQTYKNTSAAFPWVDKYCDFKGMQGVNFRNFAVTATPTLFLIDRYGNIQGKYARIDEVTMR